MILLLFSALFIRVLSDLCFKAAVHSFNIKSMSDFYDQFFLFFKRPIFLLALTLGVAMLGLWSVVLRYYELSFAYPLFSFSYVLIMLIGSYIYKERLDVYKLSGMFFIILAVLFLLLGSL